MAAHSVAVRTPRLRRSSAQLVHKREHSVKLHGFFMDAMALRQRHWFPPKETLLPHSISLYFGMAAAIEFTEKELGTRMHRMRR
jgi:hypothetical protein